MNTQTRHHVSSAPVQVAESNLTVTYKYCNDDELIQANQQAVLFSQQARYVSLQSPLNT